MRRGSSGLSLLIGVNKPTGMSSHDVVGRVRRALGERRVGHAGTLDPEASGVLVIGVGPATRLMGYLTADDKGYVARIAFGSATNTDDAAGEVIRTAETPARLSDEAYASKVLEGIVGSHMQVPPAFSAIHVDGRRSYAMARAGEKVDLEPRQVRVFSAKLDAIEQVDPPIWRCSLLVSKGCYVRSIARDLGEALGSAAHLCGLERTSSGPVGKAACVTLDELAELGPEGISARALDPVWALGIAVRAITADELESVRCGRPIDAGMVRDPLSPSQPRRPHDGELVSLVVGDRLMGVWECAGSRLRTSANFSTGVTGVRGEWS